VRAVPDFGQQHLSTHPSALSVNWLAVVPPVAELPALIEPLEFPRVERPSTESLVPIEHPRISVVEAYREAGWSAAQRGMWLRSSAMQRLANVADGLPEPWGLHVFDAWRPLDLQAELYAAAYADPLLPPGFVSEPNEDPQAPPPHLSGGTLDLTLTYAGTPLSLGTSFDDFTAAARADSLESSPSVERELRRMLFWAMHAEGYVVLDCEWWHFEYGTRRWAAIMGSPPLFGPAEPPK
jgi:D-alanyl-D-alanine dipeptidase